MKVTDPLKTFLRAGHPFPSMSPFSVRNASTVMLQHSSTKLNCFFITFSLLFSLYLPCTPMTTLHIEVAPVYKQVVQGHSLIILLQDLLSEYIYFFAFLTVKVTTQSWGQI